MIDNTVYLRSGKVLKPQGENKMSNVHDLKKFKAVKLIDRDLAQLVKVLDLNIKGFQNYKHYIPIAKVLATLNEQRTILAIHLEKCKQVLKDKGKVE